MTEIEDKIKFLKNINFQFTTVRCLIGQIGVNASRVTMSVNVERAHPKERDMSPDLRAMVGFHVQIFIRRVYAM